MPQFVVIRPQGLNNGSQPFTFSRTVEASSPEEAAEIVIGPEVDEYEGTRVLDDKTGSDRCYIVWDGETQGYVVPLN